MRARWDRSASTRAAAVATAPPSGSGTSSNAIGANCVAAPTSVACTRNDPERSEGSAVAGSYERKITSLLSPATITPAVKNEGPRS
jgi:hypothetical protein